MLGYMGSRLKFPQITDPFCLMSWGLGFRVHVWRSSHQGFLVLSARGSEVTTISIHSFLHSETEVGFSIAFLQAWLV